MLTARDYDQLASRIGKVLPEVRDQPVRDALHAYRAKLDETAQRQVVTGDAARWTAERQRREAKRVIDEAVKIPEAGAAPGLVTPRRLSKGLNREDPWATLYPAGDFWKLAELANAGSMLLRRDKALPMNLPRGAASAAGAWLGLSGNPVFDALAPLAVHEGLGRVVMSPLAQQYFKNQTAAGILGTIDTGGNAARQGVLGLQRGMNEYDRRAAR